MSARIARRLDESDTRPDLRARLAEITIIQTRGTGYVGLPRTSVQLLVRRRPSASTVDVHVIGPRTRALRKPALPHRAVAIRFAAGSARAILGTSIGALVGRVVPITELWRDNRMLDELAGAELEQYSSIVQAALARRIGVVAKPFESPAMRHAATALDLEPNLRVRDLARRLGTSERQLRRQFEDALGLSPKQYARVVRISHALELANRHRTWADIALAAGYYDQAQMIGQFREATGVTPRALVAELVATERTHPQATSTHPRTRRR